MSADPYDRTVVTGEICAILDDTPFPEREPLLCALIVECAERLSAYDLLHAPLDVTIVDYVRAVVDGEAEGIGGPTGAMYDATMVALIRDLSGRIAAHAAVVHERIAPHLREGGGQ